MWASFLLWLKDNQVGDLTGVLGILISIFGFFVTLTGVLRSKAASERAEEAVRLASERMRLVDTVVDFTMAISILDEIKRAHRVGQLNALPDRYSAIRKILISLRASNGDLEHNQVKIIQSSLANLSEMERNVERAIANEGKINSLKFNKRLSDDIDNLYRILAEFKALKGGEYNDKQTKRSG